MYNKSKAKLSSCFLSPQVQKKNQFCQCPNPTSPCSCKNLPHECIRKLKINKNRGIISSYRYQKRKYPNKNRPKKKKVTSLFKPKIKWHKYPEKSSLMTKIVPWPCQDQKWGRRRRHGRLPTQILSIVAAEHPSLTSMKPCPI